VAAGRQQPPPQLTSGSLDGLPPPWSCDPRELDTLDAEAILRDKWRYLVRLHQQRVGDRLWIANGPQGASILDAAERPEGFQALPEGVRVLDCWTVHHEGEDHLVFVEERAMRFVTWPGLGPPGVAGRDPDAVAREVVASKLFSRMRPGSRLSHYAAAEAQALCTAVICSRVG
jgi:hypothetical protein